MTRLIFIGFLSVLIWLPIAQMVVGFHLPNTVDENRKLALPPFFHSLQTLDQFAAEGVKWFNDNYGFRDLLIRTKTQIDYSIFGISTKVYIGKEGWLFYRSVMDVQKPLIDRLLLKESDAVINGTRKLAKTLDSKGIKLVILMTPMKDVYYSSYLPYGIKSLPSPRQVELLEARFRSMDEIIFIDSSLILKELSRHRNVFHKTDFHWNDPAAFEVAKILVDDLAKQEGKAMPFWTHKLEIVERKLTGGEASFMPIFLSPSENGLFVKQNWIQPPFKLFENSKPFVYIYEAQGDIKNDLQPITVLGDSFFDGMIRSGMWDYFKKVYRANWNSTDLNEILRNLPKDTKYLLLEFTEVDSRPFDALAAKDK